MSIKRVISQLRNHKKFSVKNTIRWFAIICSVIFAIGVLAISIAFALISRNLPDPSTLITKPIAQTTKIYDRTEKNLLYEIHGDENRTLIKITDLPSYVPHASVAIEDKTFYEHHGISIAGMLRAIASSILHIQKIKGTSTITQQLIKNAILTNERSVLRKLKEIILSVQLERSFKKDQILQMYLNEIPYGSNIYGVESAAHTYFGKSAKDLTLDEAALLAAMPQAPDTYSPYGTGSRGDNRKLLVDRQHYVLTQMQDQGYVSQQDVESAKKVDTLKKIIPKKIGDISAPHFVMYVRSLLNTIYGQNAIETGGYKVITTLDWDKEKIAEEEVKAGVNSLGSKFNFTNASLVAIDPKNGQILSMVGSKDFFNVVDDGQVNVALRPRQPGSSFKPIVYSAGFAKGYTPEMTLWDVNTVFKTEIGKDYEPKNYDLKEHGPVSARIALQGSLNIPAVKMLYLVGVGRVLDYAKTLGYTTFDERSRFGLSLVLGGGEVKLLEHTNAYAAFANEGEQFPTSAILRVEDANGNILEEWKKPDPNRVLDTDSALKLNDVLSDNASRAYIFGEKNYLTLPDRPVAVKTGTTNNYHDAWTLGYVPQLVAGVWVGNNDNHEMKKGADGSQIAAPIWNKFMKRVLVNTPPQGFNPPPPNDTIKPILQGLTSTVKVNIDMTTGLPATTDTPPYRIQQTTYHGEAHDTLYYLDKDDPRGPAPSNYADDPQFTNWENGVQDWVKRSGWNTTSTLPAGFIGMEQGVSGTNPIITILNEQNATWNSRTSILHTSVSSSQKIVRVEATYLGNILGETTTSPWDFTIHIPALLEKGFHDIHIIATDSFGNKGTATLTINLNAEPEPFILHIQKPIENDILTKNQFPYIIEISASDITNAKKLSVYLQTEDGSTTNIAEFLNPRRLNINIPWSIFPVTSTYTLFPVIEDNTGNKITGDRTKISVE